jgi:tRNAThr (cytosine32-N3)-methyltransferase
MGSINGEADRASSAATDPQVPPHRSHDPEKNLKRTDPFQFGSRLLSEEDNVFEFNAWDHVETDDTYKEYAELQYAKQRESPVSDFDKSKLPLSFVARCSFIFTTPHQQPDDLKIMHSSSEAYKLMNETNSKCLSLLSELLTKLFCSLPFWYHFQTSYWQSEARFNSDPAKWWNNFYKNNTANFFKDRKWLQQEFPVLSTITSATSPPATLLEVGAGAGNTAFPILKHNQNPNLKIHACDFSKKAIDVIRGNEAYDGGVHIQADVWDVASDSLPPGLEEGSVDVVLMIFIFSALSPVQWAQAVRNIHTVLKPGGEVLFRDYGRGDLAQVRFKKGRYLEENFYIRGDGTRVYFFEKDELAQIWAGGDPASSEPGTTGFEVIDLAADRRLLVNRAKELKMYRCWMQGRFKKLAAPG